MQRTIYPSIANAGRAIGEPRSISCTARTLVLVCVVGAAWVLFDLAMPVRVEAIKARCAKALGPLADAKMDGYVEDAWKQCPCSWSDVSQRIPFKKCIAAAAKALVANGEMPNACKADVKQSATHSTCGLVAEGGVACCFPLSAKCKILHGGTDLCTSLGGTVGAAPSCYDACPPQGTPVCSSEPADEDTAFATAQQDIASAQGAPFDITDPEQASLAFEQTARKVSSCYLPPVTLQFAPEPQGGGGAAEGSSLSGCHSDCMPPFDDSPTTGFRYCGPGYQPQNQWLKRDFRCNTCLNRACWEHDGCTGDLCTFGHCMFTDPPPVPDALTPPSAPRGDTCTQCFFDSAQVCRNTALVLAANATTLSDAATFADEASCIHRVQLIAYGLGVVHNDPVFQCQAFWQRANCATPVPFDGYCNCPSLCRGCAPGTQRSICCIPQDQDICDPFFAPCLTGECDPNTYTCPLQCPDPACESGSFTCDQGDNFIP